MAHTFQHILIRSIITSIQGCKSNFLTHFSTFRNTKVSKLAYESSPGSANHSQKLNFTVNNMNEDPIEVVEKEIHEREPVYSGIISAGSGSVSSTKIKNELEGKKRKKFKKIEYLNKAPAGSTHKASLTQYQRKYKFTPASVISSTRVSKQSKPPLSTGNATIVSSGVPTYKYSRSRVDTVDSNRGYNSVASYDSNEPTERDNSNTVRNYMKDTKKSVAAKLSATLPKSSGYKKFTSSSVTNKAQIQHKKQTSGQRFKIYTNSGSKSKETEQLSR